MEAGPKGKKEHGRPGGLWDFTAGGGEVRAEEAAWRSKKEEKRQQVNLSPLKNISCRVCVGRGQSLATSWQDTELLRVCDSAPLVLRTPVTSIYVEE